ncbi:MAG: FlgD immunoglobulin-like domain containing protein [Candidatus Eisenbacteria bacterium]
MARPLVIALVAPILMTLALALLPVGVPAANVTWATYGSPASLADSNQVLARSIPDGSGGAFIVWEDYRSGTADVYAQHLDGSGIPLWGANGALVVSQANGQESPILAKDGSGGIIVAWQDSRSGAYDIYAQALDAAGATRWTAGGIPLCTATGNQVLQVATEDASGGAIIAWRDLRGADSDIYAQRVDSAGTALWTVNGLAVCDTIGTQTDVRILSDQQGGAFILWRDRRGGATSDLYAQRVNPSGTTLWTKNGVVVTAAVLDQLNPVMISDGHYGFIAAWHDSRNGLDYNIFAQRVRQDGVPAWTANGVGLCLAAGSQQSPVIASDGAAGAIVAWVDPRTSARPDVYVQRVDSLGVMRWAADGVAACATDSSQFVQTIVTDMSGGAIIGWDDDRAGFREVFTQHVNASGTPLWASLGLKIATGSGQRNLRSATSDGQGGCIFAWEDFRSGPTSDIYAYRVTSIGTAVGSAVAPVAPVRLYPARPNPFNPQTILSFRIDRAGPVRLALYDVQGRLVRELVRGARAAGTHDVAWDGTDSRGTPCASGVYFALLQSGSTRRQTSLTLLR